MDTMAPIRPIVQSEHRISLTAGPAAAAAARNQVRAAIYVWDLPLDPDVAILLTSELVTNAIRHEAGETVTLVLSHGCDQLRVEVHDSSRSVPTPAEVAPDAEAGRGLMLVASLSADWGYYRTPAGKAVYFTLGFEPGPPGGPERGPQAEHTWAR